MLPEILHKFDKNGDAQTHRSSRSEVEGSVQEGVFPTKMGMSEDHSTVGTEAEVSEDSHS